MRKLTGKKIEIEEEQLYCDFCDKIIDASEKNINGLENSAILSFSFGYFSNRDGDNWDWNACHICADELARIITKYKNEKQSDFIKN